MTPAMQTGTYWARTAFSIVYSTIWAKRISSLQAPLAGFSGWVPVPLVSLTEANQHFDDFLAACNSAQAARKKN